jgi:hypothetical protein
VCKIFYFLVLKESASLLLLPLLHVVIHAVSNKATKAVKQIPSGIKSEISYTPEDGHVGRNM